jgi:hypothetical protein
MLYFHSPCLSPRRGEPWGPIPRITFFKPPFLDERGGLYPVRPSIKAETSFRCGRGVWVTPEPLWTATAIRFGTILPFGRRGETMTLSAFRSRIRRGLEFFRRERISMRAPANPSAAITTTPNQSAGNNPYPVKPA